MTDAAPEELSVPLENGRAVSALWIAPKGATACFVMAHGAGAGMRHPFLEAIAIGLAQHRIATLRYQFPYMESGSKRPDAPALCHAVVRSAESVARERTDAPIFAGGRSFGGRMTSQAQAIAPLKEVRGIAFLGFPLHPAKKPSIERARHLSDVHVPMLFLQGTRDELADLALLEPLVQQLKDRSVLELFEHANHAFHVPARSGKNDREILDDLIDRLASWIRKHSSGEQRTERSLTAI